MQTFLIDWAPLGYGLEHLDRRRLVKQLLETRQIMAALAGTTKGWVNHPATRMWSGKEDILFDYACVNARELEKLGYKFTNNLSWTTEFYNDIAEKRATDGDWSESELDRVIYTHRGRLYEKDPIYYAQWVNFSDFKKYVCCERCDYYWPSHIWERALHG
jgi:isopentenyldiphosphate isomerase